MVWNGERVNVVSHWDTSPSHVEVLRKDEFDPSWCGPEARLYLHSANAFLHWQWQDYYIRTRCEYRVLLLKLQGSHEKTLGQRR